MNQEQLLAYFESRQHVLWAKDEEGNYYLKHEIFDKENEKLKIEPRALVGLTPEKLDSLLVAGRDVDHITRITGYFSKVGGWNKGKLGELKDRQRVLIE